MKCIGLLFPLALACTSSPFRSYSTDGGRAANGDAAVSPSFGGDSSTSSGTFTSVSVSSSDEVCGLKTDGTIACWGNIFYPQREGTFTSVSVGSGFACGVRTDKTITCWGGDSFGNTMPPPCTFASVSTGWDFACGLKTDGTIACWGNNAFGDTTPPAGTFKSLGLSTTRGGYDCGVRTDGTIACWGNRANGDGGLPGGTFKAVSVGCNNCPCGVKTDGTIACCVESFQPNGTFTFINQFCAVRTDGTVDCWDHTGEMPPSDIFISVSVGSTIACGVTIEGVVNCWFVTTSCFE